jgi:hypothetical protein
VFTLLSTIYIGLAVETHDHHWNEWIGLFETCVGKLLWGKKTFGE